MGSTKGSTPAHEPGKERKTPDAFGATSYAEITPLAPEWLWEGRIPLHENTVIAGDGGIGKGFLMADLVSRVTRGADMPDGSPGVAGGSVIMVTVEDDPSMAMSYRLRAAGADLTKVFDMTTADFTIPDSLPQVAEACDAIGDVRLIVLDPLSAVSSISITSGNVRIRRNLMNPLERVAKQLGLSVLSVHHTVKSGRTAGAKAITDTARQVLKVQRSPNDDRVRVVSVDKTNIASDATPDVCYTVAGDWPDVGVRWLALPDTGGPVKALSTPERIVALFTSAAKAAGDPVELHSQDIARELELPAGTVRVNLTRMKDGGIVEPGDTRGYWRLRIAPDLVDVDAK